MLLKNKGQISIELLIVISVVVITAIIFASIYLSNLKKSSDSSSLSSQNDIISNFELDLNAYERPNQPNFNFSLNDFFGIFVLCLFFVIDKKMFIYINKTLF